MTYILSMKCTSTASLSTTHKFPHSKPASLSPRPKKELKKKKRKATRSGQQGDHLEDLNLNFNDDDDSADDEEEDSL